MQVKNLLLLGFVAFVLTACGDKQVRVISPEESATLGFNVEGESVLENPPADKARIYVMRESKVFGSGGEFPLYYLYSSPNTYKDEKGKLRMKDEVRKDIAKKSQNNFMGLLSNEAKLWQDFEANKPLLFMISQKKSFLDFARYSILGLFGYWALPDEEDVAYLIFTPKAGKIYCFEPIKYQALMGIFDRFYSNESLFIDRQSCEKFF